MKISLCFVNFIKNEKFTHLKTYSEVQNFILLKKIQEYIKLIFLIQAQFSFNKLMKPITDITYKHNQFKIIFQSFEIIYLLKIISSIQIDK